MVQRTAACADVAAALPDTQQRETLDDIPASWRAETPPDDNETRDADAELDLALDTGPGVRRRIVRASTAVHTVTVNP